MRQIIHLNGEVMLSLILHLALIVILAEARIQKRCCASLADILIPAPELAEGREEDSGRFVVIPSKALKQWLKTVARFDR